MNRTRIKICGVKEIGTGLEACKAGADAIGLVFVEKSPRYVMPEMAERIAAHLPAFVEPVGLFVDCPSNKIRQICAFANIHTVQLHGHEDVSFADELEGLRVIRALPFNPEGIEAAKPWAEHHRVQSILYDTPPQPEVGLTGGSGQTFEWSILEWGPASHQERTILAGGLTPGNVGRAITSCLPYAVDVSSGVESSRGVKDVGLIHAFCDAVRMADEKIRRDRTTWINETDTPI